MLRSSYALGAVTIILTLVGWSSIPLFLKHFADQIDAWTSNGWRYGFSALLWAPVLIAGAALRTLPKGLFKAAIVPSVINALGQVCFTWAHYKIDPGLLTFGLRSQILFVTLGAVFLFPAERRIIKTRGYIIGISMVVLGTVGTIVFEDGFGAAATTYGVVLAIASGAFFAGYALSVRKYMHGFNPIVSFAAISQYTAAAMLVLMFIFGERSGATALALPQDQFSLLLISAVIGIALGHVFYYTSIAQLGVAVSSGVIQLQPFTVSIGSLLIFGEVLGLEQWIAGVLAVSGAGLVLYVQHRMTRRDARERLEGDTEHFDDLPLDKVAAAAAGEAHESHRQTAGQAEPGTPRETRPQPCRGS